MQINKKSINKRKIPVNNLYFVHFSSLLVDNIMLRLHICTSWTELTINIAFVNDLQEEGFQESNHVGA